MTNSRHHAAPMRTRGRRPADRILAAGLATATCVGIVGVLGVRMAEANTAAQAGDASLAVDTTPLDAAAPTSSAGLTQEQLDAYAAQLQQEGAKLDAYRASLTKIANKLQKKAASGSSASAPRTVTAPTVKSAPKPVAKPAPKPAPKPVAKPAPKAQSKSKGS